MNTNRHAESENATNTLLRMQTARKVNVSAVLLTAVAFFLLVAAVGGYFFNWTWTGFQGNTLWDWLVLLAIPIAFVAVNLTYAEYQREKKAFEEKQRERETSLQA